MYSADDSRRVCPLPAVAAQSFGKSKTPCTAHRHLAGGRRFAVFGHSRRRGQKHGERGHGLLFRPPISEPRSRESGIQSAGFHAKGTKLCRGIQLLRRGGTPTHSGHAALQHAEHRPRHAAHHTAPQCVAHTHGGLRRYAGKCRRPRNRPEHYAQSEPSGGRRSIVHPMLCQLLPHRPRYGMYAERLSGLPRCERHEVAFEVRLHARCEGQVTARSSCMAATSTLPIPTVTCFRPATNAPWAKRISRPRCAAPTTGA